MVNKLKRFLAVIMVVAFLLPNSAVYASADDEEKGVELGFDLAGGQVLMTDDKAPKFLSTGGVKTYTYPLEINPDNKDKKISKITISSADDNLPQLVEDIELDAEKNILSGSNSILDAKLDKFPETTEKINLTITLNQTKYEHKFTPTITVLVTGRNQCSPEIEIPKETDKFKTSVGLKDGSVQNGFYENDEVNFTIEPIEEYRLVSFDVVYTEKQNGTTEVKTLTPSNSSYKEWNVSWNVTGKTTITGKIKGSRTQIQNIVTEKIPNTFTVRVKGDSGVTIDNPSSGYITVTEGQNTSVYVRATAKSGYLFSDCTIQSGRSYGSWVKGQNFLTLGNSRIEVTDNGNSVNFTIPDIYEDMTVTFNSTYDHNNIPIEISEGSRIDIYTDSPSTVSSGSNALFYISTTADNYIVSKITLKVGNSQNTVNADNGEIIVGNKNYRIDNMGGGVYALLVEDITEPIRVSATSASTSTNVSRPSLSISGSSNVKITKSTNNYYINSGDNVYFYFTPYTNYQISEITLTVGNITKSVSPSRTSITVGNNTYMLSRNAAGMVTLYLTNVTQNIRVSATAYFTKDDVTPTTAISLNRDTRSPFISGYTDGTFKPKNNMTKSEAVSMLYKMSNVSNVTYDNIFADVPSTAWYASQVNTFANAGIIDHTTYFYPNNYITRAEMAELIYRLMGSPEVTTSNVYFLDISNTQNNSAIRYCASQGWINGYPDNTFKPYNYMTRDEVVTMMCRVLNRKYGNMSQKFSDVKPSYWAYSYIQMASSYV